MSIRRENDAREQLAVDLTFSKDVYSPSPFIGPREVGNDLETMTEALSLGENGTREPPEMGFGYLVPMSQGKKKNYYDEDHEKGVPTGKVSLPMGVRLLLKDWEVGTKAKDYVFQDPYSTLGDSGSHSNVHSVLQGFGEVTMVPSMLQAMSSQRPPMIMSSQALGSGLGSQTTQQLPAVIELPPVRSTGMFGTRPQDEPSMSQVSQDHSQQPEQYIASTQVLPEPHGRRPKKKPPKKRLGGF